jgi:signal transduction histidine kinase
MQVGVGVTPENEPHSAADASVAAAPGEGLESWRREVLRGMLTVAAVVSPVVVLISLSAPSARHSPAKAALMGAAGLAFPALRLLPRLSVRTRASLAIALAFAIGVLALVTFGFSSGPGVVMVGTCVFAVIFLGRAHGLLLILLSVGAFFTVGVLAAEGKLTMPGLDVDLDPHRLRNWTRIGVSFAFLATFLTAAVDFVIRHVEASSRATAGALGRLRLAHAHLGQLHVRLDATKEEERRALSRELHDEMGQTLTALKLRLQLGGVAAGDAEPLALVDDLIARVREISVDLRPPLLDEIGLYSALRVYLEGQAARSGLAITLEADEPGRQERLPPEFEITCFRLVQESVTNALRHAGASRVEVRIARGVESLLLSIHDDGHGFAPASLDDAAARGHLGVVGMRERVRARGGRFRLVSAPGAGATVEAELPAPRG